MNSKTLFLSNDEDDCADVKLICQTPCKMSRMISALPTSPLTSPVSENEVLKQARETRKSPSLLKFRSVSPKLNGLNAKILQVIRSPDSCSNKFLDNSC